MRALFVAYCFYSHENRYVFWTAQTLVPGLEFAFNQGTHH